MEATGVARATLARRKYAPQLGIPARSASTTSLGAISGVPPQIAQARAVLANCYMRVSRSLVEQNLDRATTEMCAQLLSAEQ